MIFYWQERLLTDYQALPAARRKKVDAAIKSLESGGWRGAREAARLDRDKGIWCWRVCPDCRLTFQRFPSGIFLRRLGS